LSCPQPVAIPTPSDTKYNEINTKDEKKHLTSNAGITEKKHLASNAGITNPLTGTEGKATEALTILCHLVHGLKMHGTISSLPLTS
jgi:hypothetical protein